MQANTIRQHFAEQRQQTGTRHRNIAAALQISEAELIAAHVGAPDDTLMRATPLHTDWKALFTELVTLGEVSAVTRNEDCVHKKVGVYHPLSHEGHASLVLGEEIDLRLFFSRWAYGFVVDDHSGQEPQHSLQFFDHHGEAVHKIFCHLTTHRAAWHTLCQRFTREEAQPPLTLRPRPVKPTETPDDQIDVMGLQQGWAALHDTHDFFALLKRFGVSRLQALRLAEARFACELSPIAATLLLQQTAQRGVPIMVFTSNLGTIQIHSGPLQRVFEHGPWISVSDQGFDLHLQQDRVSQAWLVRKPTRDGLVSSLELFNAQGETIAMMFGARKPGIPERSDWRALLDWLQDEAALCTA